MGDNLVPNGLSMVCKVLCSKSMMGHVARHDPELPALAWQDYVTARVKGLPDISLTILKLRRFFGPLRPPRLENNHPRTTTIMEIINFLRRWEISILRELGRSFNHACTGPRW